MPNRWEKWNIFLNHYMYGQNYVYVINYMNYFYLSPFPPIRYSKTMKGEKSGF